MAKRRRLGRTLCLRADWCKWLSSVAPRVVRDNGYGAGREIVRSIRRAARSVPGVIEVEKCRVRKMGLDFYVDLHVGVKDSISVRDGHEIAHQVKAAIQQN